MPRSRRLSAGTALPAAALAAALVLTPATAFAAEGDPVVADAPTTAATPADAPGTTTPSVAPAPTTDAAAAGTSAAGTSAAGTSTSDGDATSASGSGTGSGSGSATGSASGPIDGVDVVADPAVTSTPDAEAAPTVAAADPAVDEAFVFIPATAGHPGQAFPVLTQGFTPGDLVHATVTGDDVPAGAEYASLPEFLTFDDEGGTAFFVELPATLPVGGFVTVTVTDDSGLSASSDLPVTTFAAAPHLEAPVGATAGIVTVTGENGLPGGYALVEVYDADELVTDLPDPSTDEPSTDEPSTGAPASDADPSVEPDPSSDADPTADEGDDVIPVDVDPVPYEVSGFAAAIVPVDADGRFSARFILPAGDFATDAYTFDADMTTESDFSDAATFTVAPAATVPTATTPGTVVPAALPVRPVAAATPVRATSLAYTGSEPSGALVWALGAVLVGAGAVVAGRLRPRRR